MDTISYSTGIIHHDLVNTLMRCFLVWDTMDTKVFYSIDVKQKPFNKLMKLYEKTYKSTYDNSMSELYNFTTYELACLTELAKLIIYKCMELNSAYVSMKNWKRFKEDVYKLPYRNHRAMRDVICPAEIKDWACFIVMYELYLFLDYSFREKFYYRSMSRTYLKQELNITLRKYGAASLTVPSSTFEDMIDRFTFDDSTPMIRFNSVKEIYHRATADARITCVRSKKEEFINISEYTMIVQYLDCFFDYRMTHMYNVAVATIHLIEFTEFIFRHRIIAMFYMEIYRKQFRNLFMLESSKIEFTRKRKKIIDSLYNERIYFLNAMQTSHRKLLKMEYDASFKKIKRYKRIAEIGRAQTQSPPRSRKCYNSIIHYDSD